VDSLSPPFYELLGWDSSVFGFNVARLTPSHVSGQTLRQNLDVITKKHDAKLVYGFFDPSDPVSREAACSCRGLLVDRRLVFTCKPLLMPPSTKHPIHVCNVREPTPAMEQLAFESGRYSRFQVDPRIPPGIFKDIYRKWIARDLRDCPPGAAFIAGEDQSPSGFITLKREKDEGRISLIAVDSVRRKQGLGQALVQQAVSWAARQGFPKLTVVTQSDNVPACRLYEKTGFQVAERVDIYHFWLEAGS
jgi:dTDP-4-amino-4,6-dideoxy-D-galactose acyltransferase